MIKLIELFNEIKVNNPNDIFQVTDGGRQVIEDMYKIFTLIPKYVKNDKSNDIITDTLHDSSKYFNMAFGLYMVSEKYGEGVLNDNKPQKIQDFQKGYDNIFGDEEGTEALSYINFWKEQSWVK